MRPPISRGLLLIMRPPRLIGGVAGGNCRFSENRGSRFHASRSSPTAGSV